MFGNAMLKKMPFVYCRPSSPRTIEIDIRDSRKDRLPLVAFGPSPEVPWVGTSDPLIVADRSEFATNNGERGVLTKPKALVSCPYCWLRSTHRWAWSSWWKSAEEAPERSIQALK